MTDDGVDAETSLSLSLFMSISLLRLYTFFSCSLLVNIFSLKMRVSSKELFSTLKKVQRKSWSNVPPKLLACIRFLYKVVHKIGRLRKFNRAREIEFNFLTAWTISMKFGTLVQHALGYKTWPQIFQFLPRDLVMVFQS